MVENNESVAVKADDAPDAPPPAEVKAEAAPVAAPPAPAAAPPAPVAAKTAEAVVADTADARRHRRQLIGKVVSTSNEKTAVVSVTRTFLHPKVRKYVRRSKKYMTHDATNLCDVGDEVLIEECRPLSKHKRWRLRKIVRKHL